MASLDKVRPEDLYITLELRLVNWVYLDLKVRTRITTPLFVIKRQLVERHGRLEALRLWKGNVSDETEMTNDSWTLAEYGIVGKRLVETPDNQVIFYDFKPFNSTEPLLLVTHQRGGAATEAGGAASPSAAATSAPAPSEQRPAPGGKE